MAKETEFEHLLIFGIIAFVVYHVMIGGGYSCCFNNGFSVGIKESNYRTPASGKEGQSCSEDWECSVDSICKWVALNNGGFGKRCQSVPGDPLNRICKSWGSDVPCNNYCCTGLFGGIIPNWELLSNRQRENYCKDKGHGVIQCYRT